MKQDYPVPPPELVRSWWEAWYDASPPASSHHWIASRAAAWGYRRAMQDARRLEARELSAFGLFSSITSESD